MTKTSDALQKEMLDIFAKVLMKRFNAVRILEGGTKSARSYTHVFVPGEVYGGKLGSMLCKKSYKKTQAYPGSFLESEMCPICAKKLVAIIAELSVQRGGKLFDLASKESWPDDFSDSEIDAAMRVVAQRQWDKEHKQPQQQQLSLVDMQLAKMPVTRTALCL